MMLNQSKNCARRRFRTLGSDTAGAAMVEFAFTAPILLVMGLFGIELAQASLMQTQLSQTAISLADNASRVGQNDNSGVAPTISEAQVDALLASAVRQAGNMDIAERGRIIISSVEYDASTGRQFIRWQRCTGGLERESKYGDDGAKNGLTGAPIAGVGSSTNKAKAQAGTGVMFVEVIYDYDSLFDGAIGIDKMEYRQEAAFQVRDDRDYSAGLTGGTTASPCD
ncbi:TadE/TadG family type IV pilus assembly protein [Alteripontixanthobacter maritimus]|nr:TadE/TadG family type IV pilus assembly protein [Alteripontixanthobacter maritimus]